MNLVFGVGNEDNGDDGVGPYVARKTSFNGWKGINCSVSPEDFTVIASKEKPEVLVIVDATDMHLPAGSLRRIPMRLIDELAISTHYIPLSVLVKYLQESAGKIVFVGIQPKTSEKMSEEVLEAAHELLELIRTNRLEDIPVIKP